MDHIVGNIVGIFFLVFFFSFPWDNAKSAALDMGVIKDLGSNPLLRIELLLWGDTCDRATLSFAREGVCVVEWVPRCCFF